MIYRLPIAYLLYIGMFLPSYLSIYMGNIAVLIKRPSTLSK